MSVSRKPDAIHRIPNVRSSRFGLPLALAESLIRLEDVSGTRSQLLSWCRCYAVFSFRMESSHGRAIFPP